MGMLELGSAFTAGVLSFLSPCILPLIPGYLSFISGVSMESLQEKSADSGVARTVFKSTLFFVAGFSLVFIALGASSTLVGGFLTARTVFFSRLAGIIVIIFGLHMVGLFRLRFLYRQQALRLPRLSGPLGAFLLGIGFAFGWTPCVGPILAGILLLASQEETIWKGVVLLAAYSAGLALPFLATAAGVQYFFRVVGPIKRYFRVIEIAAGCLLIIVGLAIFTGSMGMLMRFIPFANRLSF